LTHQALERILDTTSLRHIMIQANGKALGRAAA
jgi:hypothetical protein